MGWSVIRHDLMAWRTLTVLPLAVAVVLFALAGAGSHLQSLNPAASLHELTYGAPAQQEALLGRSCSNCHTQVHGSNHPSGVQLTR